jgi:hypothetical protein
MAREAGISFRFETGSRGKYDLPEIMGGGVAVFEADGDGRPDIYLCNGGPIEPAPGKPDPPCRLYLNQGQFRFKDVTATAAAPGPSYAMGVATGDYDGDGRVDLFVTGWRDQRLYRNLGGGRFEDVTLRARLTSNRWSTSAAFADLDGDGDLDLYVATYVDFDPAMPPFCAAPDGKRDYCGPEDFPAQPDQLFRNNGDGTFTDVSTTSGIDRPGGRGLGVLIGELTGDRRPDIYVANDSSPCWLFANQGNFRFFEIAEGMGVARDGQGQLLSGMGVALGDLEGDRLCDLVVTNFYDRSTVAFQCLHDIHGTFYRDRSSAQGLTAATHSVLGFGVALVDFNGDGWIDLIQANGHVEERARLGIPFAMCPTLLVNTGGRFRDGAPQAERWFARPILGRGLAVADLDADGRTDVVVGALDAPVAILRNLSDGGTSVALDLIDRAGAPAAGARVRVVAADRDLAGALCAGGSYLSASESRLVVGVGTPREIDRVEVEWPWGKKETWLNPKPSSHGILRIKEGSGRTDPLPKSNSGS